MPISRLLRIAIVLLALAAMPHRAAAWPADVVVTNAPGPQAEPEVVTDGAGGAIVFWRDYTSVESSSNAPGYARRILASGVADPAWPEQGRMIFEGGWFFGQSIVPDGVGGAFVGWASSNRVLVQHLLSNGTFDPAWPTGGRVVRDGGATPPTLLSDGLGGVLVAWTEDVASIASLVVKHLDAAGTFDPTWPLEGVLVSHDVGFGLSMVTDHAGGALIVWRPVSSGSHGLAHHVTANGALDSAWPAGGRAFGEAAYAPGVIAVSDGAGGVIVLWTFYHQVASYAQHFLANGDVDPAWPAAGVLYGGVATSAAAVANGEGGVISAWLSMPDPKNNNSYYVYGQRILEDGEQDPQWPESGLYVANTGSDRPVYPRAVSDGAGGAIVAFEGYGFVAVTRLLSSGVVDPSWPVNGRLLSSHAASTPGLAADGAGGVIVAWTELSGSDEDIHAQRVSISGASTSVPELFVGLEPMLTRVAPTPTRGASTIDFTMPVAGRVALTIHDIGGRKVSDLLRADVGAGAHSVTWSGSVEGRRAPNGVYFVRMETGSVVRMRRLVLVR